MEYLASSITEVSSNLYVEPSPILRISFLLLLICTEELMSKRNIITFLPNSLFTKKSERKFNLRP